MLSRLQPGSPERPGGSGETGKPLASGPAIAYLDLMVKALTSLGCAFLGVGSVLVGCGGRGQLEGERGNDAFLEVPDGGVTEQDDAEGGRPPAVGGAPNFGGAAGAPISMGGRPIMAGGSAGGFGVGGRTGLGGMVGVGGVPGTGGRTGEGGAFGGQIGVGGAFGGSAGNGGVGGTPQGGSGGSDPMGCEVDSKVEPGYSCVQYTSCPDYFSQTSCYSLGDGRARCSCSDGAGYRELDVTGVSPDQACAPMFEECRNPTPITDPPKCSISNESRSQDDCVLDEECVTAVTKDGITLSDVSTESANCYRTGPDWECSCDSSEPLQTESIGLDGSISSKGLCAEALRTCDQGLVDSGTPVSCDLIQFSATPSDCYIQQECSEEGLTPSGLSAFTKQWVSAQCFVVQEMPIVWTCQCQDGANTMDFVGLSGFEVCEQAAVSCQR